MAAGRARAAAVWEMAAVAASLAESRHLGAAARGKVAGVTGRAEAHSSQTADPDWAVAHSAATAA